MVYAQFALASAFCLAIGGPVALIAQAPANYTGVPYADSAATLPGRVSIERFDQGAVNVAWYDSTSGNSGDYVARNPTDVDLSHFTAIDRLAPGSTATLSLSDVYLRSAAAGDWLKFTVNVKQAATYSLNAQIGVQGTQASKIRLDILQGADSTALGNITLPNSGCNSAQTDCSHNWDYARTLAQVPLRAGVQVLRMQVVTGGFNISYLDFMRPDSGSPTYRVNSGGPAFTDSRGRAWEADAHFTGGSTISYPEKVRGTDMQSLYQSERYYDPAKAPLKYTFTVPNGEYFVRLHFAETWSGFNKAGFRVFDVTLNGATILKSFDISALVGVDSVLVKEFPLHVAAGSIEIGFINRIEHAKISGIEIIPGASTAIADGKRLSGGKTEAKQRLISLPDWGAATRPEVIRGARDMRGRKAPQSALRLRSQVLVRP